MVKATNRREVMDSCDCYNRLLGTLDDVIPNASDVVTNIERLIEAIVAEKLQQYIDNNSKHCGDV